MRIKPRPSPTKFVVTHPMPNGEHLVLGQQYPFACLNQHGRVRHSSNCPAGYKTYIPASSLVRAYMHTTITPCTDPLIKQVMDDYTMAWQYTHPLNSTT
jgi:hypothetical protein